MKKVLSKEALDREASFWTSLKKALKESPVKACRK
jgi:hypothetical protein